MSASTLEGPSGSTEPKLTHEPELGLVGSKLRPPWGRPGLVTRSSLIERLVASEAPIVTVVAGAGYGKTTLLGQWAQESELATAWLSLDHEHDDPGALLHYLLAALDRIEPIDAEVVRSMLAEVVLDASWAVRGLAVIVSSLPTPFLLVLDHVEQVTNPRAGDLIAALALNLPPGSRLALASRVEPPIPTARLRAQGLLAEIGPDQLVMGADEAGALVAGAGLHLGPEETRELIAATEGWPVGLYLACLAIKEGGAGPANRGRAPHGDDRVVADYLRDEVLAGLPPVTMTFLTRTSVLSRLSGPLCDAVLGTVGSQAVLESLEQSNLLVVPLDRNRQWYRCHHLLSELLRAELERTEPDLVGRLHDRAAAWLEGNGQPEQAIDHAQAAGDADRAARLFAQVAQATHTAGRNGTNQRWLAWFDERGLIESYAYIPVIGSILESLTGGGATVELLADAASASDLTGPAPDGSPLAAWVGMMDACLCRQGVDQMREDAARSTPLMSRRGPFRGPIVVLEGIAALLQGKADEADPLLAAGGDLCFRIGGAPSGVLAVAERAVIALDRGDWTTAARFGDEAVEIAHELHLESHVQSIAAFAVAARTAAQQGDVARARTMVAAAQRLRPLCTVSIPWSAQLLVQLAHAYLTLADPAGARAVLRQVRDILLVRPHLGVVAEQHAELSQMLDAISVGSVGASALTAAELRLLPFLATHLSYRDIGERLHVSRNTIKSEAVSVFRKLGVSSRSEAVDVAERVGLLGR